jgi:predicted MFS family arabinose efflux permease
VTDSVPAAPCMACRRCCCILFQRMHGSFLKGCSSPTTTTNLLLQVMLAMGIGGAIGVVGGGILGQWLYNRNKKSMPMFIGICTMLASFPLWFVINADVQNMAALAFIATAIAGVGSGTVGPNMRAMMLNVNEPETRGVALALQVMLDDLGKGE